MIFRLCDATEHICKVFGFFGHIVAGSSEAQIIKDENGNDKAVNKKFTVNVRDLCWKICRLAEVCYKEDKDKFNFFNYNLVDIDYRTRRVFGIKDSKVIK